MAWAGNCRFESGLTVSRCAAIDQVGHQPTASGPLHARGGDGRFGAADYESFGVTFLNLWVACCPQEGRGN